MTPEEREAIEGEIRALKSLLVDTDYNSNKIIESLSRTLKDVEEEQLVATFATWLRTFLADYNTILTNRENWRTRINELEEMLDETEASD